MTDYVGQASITILAPVEVVYDYLSDFTRHPEWASNLKKVTQMTDGSPGVGTKFRTSEGPPPVRLRQKLGLMRQFLMGIAHGAKPYSEATITALERPHAIAWWAGIPKGDGFFNRAEWRFELVPQGQGTQLTQCFRWQPQDETAERMVQAAGVDGLTEAVGVSLVELKRRLESNQVL